MSNIEYANTALANSQANYRYNLVHVQQHNWANDDSLGSAQLESFRRKDRTTDPAGMMRDVAEYLSAEEIAAVAEYVAGLH